MYYSVISSARNLVATALVAVCTGGTANITYPEMSYYDRWYAPKIKTARALPSLLEWAAALTQAAAVSCAAALACRGRRAKRPEQVPSGYG